MASSALKKIAIATTLYLSDPSKPLPQVTCGLVEWCINAVRFSELDVMQGRVEVVVLTNAPDAVRDACPQPSVLLRGFGEDLLSAAKVWAQDYVNEGPDWDARKTASYIKWPGPGGWRTPPDFNVANLVKWEAVRMFEYESVWLLDSDIDLFVKRVRPNHNDIGLMDSEPSAARAYLLYQLKQAWTEGYGAFLRGPELLRGWADPGAFINGGMMLLKPSQRAFDTAIALLHSLKWSVHFGFNHTGRPVQLMTAEELRATRVSSMQRTDDWNIVNGDSDQVRCWGGRAPGAAAAHASARAPARQRPAHPSSAPTHRQRRLPAARRAAGAGACASGALHQRVRPDPPCRELDDEAARPGKGTPLLEQGVQALAPTEVHRLLRQRRARRGRDPKPDRRAGCA